MVFLVLVQDLLSLDPNFFASTIFELNLFFPLLFIKIPEDVWRDLFLFVLVVTFLSSELLKKVSQYHSLAYRTF